LKKQTNEFEITNSPNLNSNDLFCNKKIFVSFNKVDLLNEEEIKILDEMIHKQTIAEPKDSIKINKITNESKVNNNIQQLTDQLKEEISKM
jgi:GTPase involved in cell partitioning and DNA repair